MKKCSKCKIDKETSEFHIDSSRKDGFQPQCKLCRSKYKQNIERKKNWYEKNKDDVIQRVSCRYEKNKSYFSEYKKGHYLKNIDKYKEKSKNNYKNRYLENSDKIKKDNAIYAKSWRRQNPHIVVWRSILRSSLKRMGKRKQHHTIEMLGYSADDLKNHIEMLWTPLMSWNNHGDWHIDHIKPVCCFDKNTHPSIVNALENLRPLWATTREINGIIYEGNLNRNKWYNK